MIRQSDFNAALLDPAQPTPTGMVNPGGAPASKRFDVYRNNVAVSLTEALETAFPVIRKLVGEDFFRAMAGVFLRQHPPDSPLMMFYGTQMPEFLAQFAPAQSLPYLPDMARLELAMRESYHAADSSPVDPAILSQIPEDTLPQLRMGFAPSLRLIRSRYPLYDIWAANMANGPAPRAKAQSVLVTRPEFDPVPDPLAPDEAAVLDALIADAPLGQALRQAAPGYDVSALLLRLLQRQALISLTIEE